MVEIYEFPKYLKIKKKELVKQIEISVSKYFKLENISIVFVDLKTIHKLNNEFRNVDKPTDVLSFNYNTQDLLGEIYICTEYIKENRKEIDLSEEVIRLIVHGILHLYGYNHKTEFVDINQPNLENMFVIQEKILADIIECI